jgi:two-component system, chemotaxis family, sensor kinase CheA
MSTATGTTIPRGNLPILFAAVASSFLAPRRSAVRAAKPRVLVIDGEHATRELLSLYLGEKGLEVATVRSAAEARPLIQRGQFDLLVLDWAVDGAEGLNLLHLCKTEHPDIPVIIFTDDDLHAQDVEGRLANEADAVTRKQGPLNALAAAIFQSLGWNEMRLQGVA